MNPPRPDVAQILVVDDEPAVLRFCKTALEEAGYGILTAPAAEDALAVVRTPGLRIDLVLIDIMLPGMSGIACAETLSSERSDIRLVLMSGHSASDIKRVVGKDAAGYRVMWKPFLAGALTQMIANVLDTPLPDSQFQSQAGS